MAAENGARGGVRFLRITGGRRHAAIRAIRPPLASQASEIAESGRPPRELLTGRNLRIPNGFQR
jgi:hypothetical protein